MDGVKIIQIILILGILGVIIYLLHLMRALRLEKRIAKYTIVSPTQQTEPLFSKLSIFIHYLVNKLSKLLSKSEVLSQYGNHYNKYIAYDDKEKTRGIDYVSFKIILAFTITLLSLITWAYQPIKIDFMIILLIFIISFFLPDIFLYFIFKQKRKQIETELLKAIIIMNNAFQGGKNIMQAIEIVKEEVDGPIQDEFKKIYLDITYGLSLDTVFNRFYDRVKLEDAKYITTSLTLLNKTGGDIVKVFSLIEKSIMDRKNLKNELNSLTASSQFLFKMLITLPLIFVLLIFILNHEYFMPLITNPLGLIILSIIIILYILYIIIIRKVLKVEI